MPANTGVAPICNAKAEPPDFSTKPPPLPKFSIPDFNNPRSLAKAIQQLQIVVNTIAGSPPPPNNTIPGFPVAGTNPGGAAPNFGGGGKQQTPKPGEWQETSRVTQNVKVVNPDDDSQFVVVKEIVSITFEEPTTGQTFTIKRDPG